MKALNEKTFPSFKIIASAQTIRLADQDKEELNKIDIRWSRTIQPKEVRHR
jgi:hypothetical protein